MTDETLQSPAGANVGRVLVADDEEINRDLFSAILAGEGHYVLVAADGAEALAKALAERPDVILLDVMMPQLNGYEVCRRLREDPRTAHIPILMITGLTRREDRLKAIQAGANDFLAKPIDNAEIRMRVRNAVYQQHLYNELQTRYQELKAMTDLHESLTSIINADTEALAALMPQSAPPAEVVSGTPPNTNQHTPQRNFHGTN